MGVPTIPSLPSIPKANVISSLLATVAIEEAALAHLVNAEAEKVQRLAATMPTPSTFEQAAEMQKIVLAVMNAVALKELLLGEKIRRVMSITIDP